jgi:hypothetical protein
VGSREATNVNSTLGGTFTVAGGAGALAFGGSDAAVGDAGDASASGYRRLQKPELQVDQNLMLYLPRLAVLVTIVTDRPGAWFPGPLGPYQA